MFPWMTSLIAIPNKAWMGPLLLFLVFGQAMAQEKVAKDATKVEKDKDGWISLMPLKDFSSWERTNFGGEGSVEMNSDNNELVFMPGQPLTGVTFKKEFPLENFEIRWEANRINGSDFFAGLTFPVGKEHCSFICGGWGGGLMGISSIDGSDASENETTQFAEVKNGKWYRFLVRVDPKHIVVMMDDKEVVNIERDGKKFSVRGEVRANRPLGYCTFQSEVAVRNWAYRALTDEKKAK